MLIELTRGEDFAFIDNEGEVLHKVKVQGSNPSLERSLDNILNTQTSIRFKGELDGVPDEIIIRDGNRPAEINKASNLYMRKYFIADMETQGFKVTIIKE